MGILRLAALGAVGYAIYRAMAGERHEPAAFAAGESGGGENFSQVRSAGPDAMRSSQPAWDKQDEASDESFPASDPPANY